MTRGAQHNERPLWTYKALLLLAAAIWGLGTVVIKATIDAFPPAWMVGVRFVVAGTILTLVMFPKIRNALNFDHFKVGGFLGIFLFLAYWTNSIGLTDTTASNSAFLTSLYCVIIPFLGWILRGPRPTRYNIVAAFVCVGGIGCVSLGASTNFSLGFGDGITLLSAVFLSFHVIYTSRFAASHNMIALTVIQFFIAGILGLGAGLLFESTPDFSNLSTDTWISLVYLAVFASCIALLMQNIGVGHVPPAPASLFLATEAVFGVVLSIVFLGELLTLPLIVGFTLIFIGIVISEYLPTRKASLKKK